MNHSAESALPLRLIAAAILADGSFEVTIGDQRVRCNRNEAEHLIKNLSAVLAPPHYDRSADDPLNGLGVERKLRP